jgi:hypothetical protein
MMSEWLTLPTRAMLGTAVWTEGAYLIAHTCAEGQMA